MLVYCTFWYPTHQQLEQLSQHLYSSNFLKTNVFGGWRRQRHTVIRPQQLHCICNVNCMNTYIFIYLILYKKKGFAKTLFYLSLDTSSHYQLVSDVYLLTGKLLPNCHCSLWIFRPGRPLLLHSKFHVYGASQYWRVYVNPKITFYRSIFQLQYIKNIKPSCLR